MPKIYSEIEKNNIRRDLRIEASKCLALYGVKKTTVDELVKRVSIPKGTFYLFYENKEALFLDMIESFLRESEDMYLSMLQELDENHIVTSLTDVFMAVVMKFYRDGIYKVLDDGELNLIYRRSDSSALKERVGFSDESIRNLFSYFMIDDEMDISMFTQAFEAVLFILLHADKIGNIEKALRFIIRGLVLQLVE